MPHSDQPTMKQKNSTFQAWRFTSPKAVGAPSRPKRWIWRGKGRKGGRGVCGGRRYGGKWGLVVMLVFAIDDVNKSSTLQKMIRVKISFLLFIHLPTFIQRKLCSSYVISILPFSSPPPSRSFPSSFSSLPPLSFLFPQPSLPLLLFSQPFLVPLCVIFCFVFVSCFFFFFGISHSSPGIWVASIWSGLWVASGILIDWLSVILLEHTYTHTYTHRASRKKPVMRRKPKKIPKIKWNIDFFF